MGVRFVDPKALPDRVSPRRYGNFLVRVFDGNLSETKEQLASRLLNTSHTTRTTQWRRSVLIQGFSSSDESVTSRGITSIKERRTKKKKRKNVKLNTPSLFRRKNDNITAPSTPHSMTPSTSRSNISSQSYIQSSAPASAFLKPKSARSQFSSPFQFKSPRSEIKPKPSSEEQLPLLLSKGKLALLKKERGDSDEPISRFLDQRIQKVEEEFQFKPSLTPLLRLNEVDKTTSPEITPRARIDRIHKLMILGRNCQVEMSSVLQQALRAKEQEDVERELHNALFGLQQMQSRQVRGHVRKFKLFMNKGEPKSEN